MPIQRFTADSGRNLVWRKMRRVIYFFVLWMVLVASLIATDPHERDSPNDASSLVRIDFIHYYNPAERTMAPQIGPSDCYSLLNVQDPTLPLHYAINPANPDNLSEDFVVSAITAAAHTWNRAVKRDAFDNHFSIDYTAQAPKGDGTNTIAFSDIFLDSSVIAATSLYIDTSTTPFTIFEFDILLNSKYTWGDATRDPNVMDLQAVVTHELGHALGLGDVWEPACSQATMYGFGTSGETQDRTLSKPDITGLRVIYQRKH
jgi:predicted Zn-dependent protease